MIKIDRLNDLSAIEINRLHDLKIKTLEDLWSFIGTNTYSGVANLAERLRIDDLEEFALRLEKIALKEIEWGTAIAFENNRLLFLLCKIYFLFKRLTPLIIFILVCILLTLRFLSIG